MPYGYPSRFTKYGGAKGAADGLREQIAARYLAQQEAQKQQQMQLETRMKQQQIAQAFGTEYVLELDGTTLSRVAS